MRPQDRVSQHLQYVGSVISRLINYSDNSSSASLYAEMSAGLLHVAPVLTLLCRIHFLLRIFISFVAIFFSQMEKIHPIKHFDDAQI